MWWRTNKHSRNPWVVTWRPRRRRSIRRNRDACAAMAAMGAPRCGDKPTACAESPLQLSAIPQRCACGYACGRVHVRIVADFSGFRWRPFRLWRFVKLRGRVLVGSILLEIKTIPHLPSWFVNSRCIPGLVPCFLWWWSSSCSVRQVTDTQLSVNPSNSQITDFKMNKNYSEIFQFN